MPVPTRLSRRSSVPRAAYLWKRAELRVNSKFISWGKPRDVLREDLSRRPHPVVYIEGHNDLQFADVVRVIDIVRED
jgi:hypothetical protein